jgi:peroxiredoxin
MIARQILAVVLGGLLTLTAWADAPNIALRDLDGRARNVNEFVGHGKWTVVVVWAHDCGICAREIGQMTALHAAHRDKDAIVLGVTLDGSAHLKEARAFVKRHKLPFVNLITEPSREVLMKFGAGEFVGTPTYYIYNPKGEIVGQNIGPVSRKEVEAFIASEQEAARDAK